MNADGSDQRQLTHTADGEGPVAWLPDGRIVSSSFHGNRPVPDWYLSEARQVGGATRRSDLDLLRALVVVGWSSTARSSSDPASSR
jgi:hypothetical protein